MTAVSQTKKQQIIDRLKSVEQNHNVKILLAIESGSRVWGIYSEDSDYDVRFIYVRPTEDYISIREMRDVIEAELNEEYDIVGWDLKKAMRLASKSNANYITWLTSTIKYTENKDFTDLAIKALEGNLNHRAYCEHHVGVLNTTLTTYLLKPTVAPKKYFYALIPMASVDLFLQHQTLPSLDFNTMMQGVQNIDNPWPTEVLSTINDLLEIKQAGHEKDKIPTIKILDDFITNWYKNFTHVRRDTIQCNAVDPEPFDQLFKTFAMTYGNLEGIA
ncbi:nucleotidyltransferase domain-containing protein [Planctomycetota bacterium]|nr:nucleotidyltransferase domain-containing protein [Planctomycetota bacterium]